MLRVAVKSLWGFRDGIGLDFLALNIVDHWNVFKVIEATIISKDIVINLRL